MHQDDRQAFITPLEVRGREIVERLGGEWQPHGGLCRCPAHDDGTPSLSIRPGRRALLFHCFAGCDTRDILRALRTGGALNLSRDRNEVPPSPADPGRQHQAAAQGLWNGSRPFAKSMAEQYLRGRGLTGAPAEIRYHPRTPCGRGTQTVFRPAMLAAVRDNSGLVGVHRTFLETRSGSVAVSPAGKRALGRLGGGAVRLMSPARGTLGLAEGIENALAASQLTDIPCWAALGAERFAHIVLPPRIDRLILFLDNDAGGRRAELLAREAHAASGPDIEARYPAVQGADWNDTLLEAAGAIASVA